LAVSGTSPLLLYPLLKDLVHRRAGLIIDDLSILAGTHKHIWVNNNGKKLEQELVLIYLCKINLLEFYVVQNVRRSL
jgi:hypothetical protein